MRTLCFLALLAAVGCTGGRPTNTDTVCPAPDPLAMGYDKASDPQCTPADGSGACFGKQFMDTYCIQCHDSKLKHSMRNGAPIYHDFDTLEGVLEVPDHIDQQSGIGPAASNDFMPPRRCPSTPGGSLDIDCPQPTDAEREQLSLWIACERHRDHDLRPDAGMGSGSGDGSGSGEGSGSGDGSGSGSGSD